MLEVKAFQMQILSPPTNAKHAWFAMALILYANFLF